MNESLSREYQACLRKFESEWMWVHAAQIMLGLIVYVAVIFGVVKSEEFRKVVAMFLGLGGTYYLIARVVLQVYKHQLKIQFAKRAMLE